MSSKANPSIGTCPCPTSGCKATCQVKKFQHKATTDGQRRNAGKVYIDCPDHGRFGFDGKVAMQDWILDHATIEGRPAVKVKPEASSAPASAASAAAAAPAASTSSSSSTAQRSGSAAGSAAAAKKPSGGFTLLG